jgi:putative nucleotidyltransferase with HDIG domain
MAASVDLPDERACLAMLADLGAPARLVRHGQLVLEAAEMLLVTLHRLGVVVEARLVRAGALLHDVGKTVHVAELDVPGARHEEAGQELLLRHGAPPPVARCCVTHARWKGMECSLEELLVALADALWKGVRRAELEEKVVAEVAQRLGKSAWDVFVELDSRFEEIADGGSERLGRSG